MHLYKPLEQPIGHVQAYTSTKPVRVRKMTDFYIVHNRPRKLKPIIVDMSMSIPVCSKLYVQ